MKKTRFTKIYLVATILVLMLAIATNVYAVYIEDGTDFRYTSSYPNRTYDTVARTKSNDTSAIVQYISGPSSSTPLFFELHASADNEEEPYTNYTIRHWDGNTYVTYYTALEGETVLVQNLVYETFGVTAFTRMHFYTPATGTVEGKWSPNT